MPHLFIFGLGYSAKRIRAATEALGWRVSATGRDGELAFENEKAVRAALGAASHVLSSVAPHEASDPVLARYGDALGHDWLGYLSSTGVYGDTRGAWVDESAAVGTGRRTARAEADAAWLGRGARVFRLPGIYGPGRSAIDQVKAGTARRIDKPGQVFSRIHVADIAGTVVLALGRARAGALYTVADDLPASTGDVVAFACELLGKPVPPAVPWDDVAPTMSAMARSFYAENRRVKNDKIKNELGVTLRYPTYKDGLRAIALATGVLRPS